MCLPFDSIFGIEFQLVVVEHFEINKLAFVSPFFRRLLAVITKNLHEDELRRELSNKSLVGETFLQHGASLASMVSLNA